MKYAIIKVVNGAYSIHAEAITDIVAAKVQYHGLCQTLWNATDVKTATVQIVNENLEPVYGYTESITHAESVEG